MSQPDWSKAPEGATHYGLEDDRYVECWYKRCDAGWMFAASNSDWQWSDTVVSLAQSRLGSLIQRPAPQWNGTGLPPVGAVCECQNDKFQWLRGTIVYVGRDRGDKLAVMQTDTEMLYGSVGEFRPIRTPEQIAADERLAAINYMEIDAGMCATAFDGDPEARVWIENLIDKGWRKHTA